MTPPTWRARLRGGCTLDGKGLQKIGVHNNLRFLQALPQRFLVAIFLGDGPQGWRCKARAPAPASARHSGPHGSPEKLVEDLVNSPTHALGRGSVSAAHGSHGTGPQGRGLPLPLAARQRRALKRPHQKNATAQVLTASAVRCVAQSTTVAGSSCHKCAKRVSSKVVLPRCGNLSNPLFMSLPSRMGAGCTCEVRTWEA